MRRTGEKYAKFYILLNNFHSMKKINCQLNIERVENLNKKTQKNKLKIRDKNKYANLCNKKIKIYLFIYLLY